MLGKQKETVVHGGKARCRDVKCPNCGEVLFDVLLGEAEDGAGGLYLVHDLWCCSCEQRHHSDDWEECYGVPEPKKAMTNADVNCKPCAPDCPCHTGGAKLKVVKNYGDVLNGDIFVWGGYDYMMCDNETVVDLEDGFSYDIYSWDEGPSDEDDVEIVQYVRK